MEKVDKQHHCGGLIKLIKMMFYKLIEKNIKNESKN